MRRYSMLGSAKALPGRARRAVVNDVRNGAVVGGFLRAARRDRGGLPLRRHQGGGEGCPRSVPMASFAVRGTLGGGGTDGPDVGDVSSDSRTVSASGMQEAAHG